MKFERLRSSKNENIWNENQIREMSEAAMKKNAQMFSEEIFLSKCW